MPISAQVKFSNGRSATITGETREEIQAAVEEYEQTLQTDSTTAQTPAPQQPPAAVQDTAPAPQTVEAPTETTALNEKDQKQIANLRQLIEIDPNQKESAEAQIAAIEDNAQRQVEGRRSRLGEAATGTAETAFAMGTAAAAEVAAGWAGIFASLPGGMDAADVVDTVRGWSYTPQTEAGQNIGATMAAPFAAYEDGVKWTATKLSGGNPIAATAIHTALMGALELAPVGRAAKVRRARNVPGRVEFDDAGNLVEGSTVNVADEVARVTKRAEEMGIDLDGFSWQRDAVTYADRVSNSRNIQDIEGAATQFAAKRKSEKAKMDQEFEAARATNAQLRTRDIQVTGREIHNTLLNRGFDLTEMPGVNKILTDIENLATTTVRGQAAPEGARFGTTTLNDMEILRRRAKNKSLGNTEEARAAGIVRERVEQFIDDAFDSQMVSGSPEALAAWKKARETATGYHDRFTANKALRNIVEMESTPEMVRNWILGANQVLPRRDVALTIRRMNEVLGPDSKEMLAVRTEIMHNLMAPLRKDTPGINTFVDNMTRFLDDNPTIVKELGFDAEALGSTRDLLKAMHRAGPSEFFGIDLSNLTARMTAGHSLSKKSALVTMLTGFLRASVRAAGGGRRAMFKEAIGVDPGGPLIPKSSIAAAGIIGNAATEQFGLPEIDYSKLIAENFRQQQEQEEFVQAQAVAQQQGTPPPAEPSATFPGIMRRLTGISNDPTVVNTGSEGFRPLPYTNNTVTNPTIGHGLELATIASRKLNDAIGRSVADIAQNGISPSESRQMVARLVANNERRLLEEKGIIYARLNGRRREAVRELAYWAGAEGALKFTKMWKHIADGNYERAADEMMRSKTVWGRTSYPSGETLYDRTRVPNNRKWAFDRMATLAQHMREG